MSILAFISDPASDLEKRFSFPLLAEAVFDQTLLPAAQQVGANMVCRLGTGIEVGAFDFLQFEKELHRCLRHVNVDAKIHEHLENRIHALIVEVREIFKANAKAIVFIG